MKVVVKVEDLKKVVSSFPKPSRLYLAPVSLTASDGQIEFAMLHNNGIARMRIPAKIEEPGKALPDPIQFKALVKNAQDYKEITLERRNNSGRLKIVFNSDNGYPAEYAIFCYPDDQEPEVALEGIEYDLSIAEWSASCAEEIWSAMKQLKQFRGDALYGYGDFFIDLDGEGTPVMFTIAGAYSVIKRLPAEVASTKLPLRLPSYLLDMLPKPSGDISLFGKHDDDSLRMYLITESTELSFSVSSKTMKLPDWLKDTISRLETLPGFAFGDRKTLLKVLQVGKSEYKNKLSINRVARLTCKENGSLLEVFFRGVDGFELGASVVLPPSDTNASKVGLFNCDLLYSLFSSLPLVEIRLGDASFAPNASVLYARDPSKSLIVAVASLDPQYFEELLTD